MMFLASTGENFFQLLIVLFCFVAVLGLTYLTTKWIAGYQKGLSGKKNLEVVETMQLAANKYVQIIRVGLDVYYVIGVGKEEISLLGQVTREQLMEFPETDGNSGAPVVGFDEILKKFRDKLPKK